ncbi:uncharacterized protein HMPREF1541_01714 [Cyphellophora europaea CBS 101466]|uniref:Uncharacterized protein n=1 Tax=Cyphellophora europaea (strain CBS 101466) TaxID=1220924 RepID=W2S1K1_CYPE1|nr:uncharacterized protein HMPREF1541_01714 [Cyphellophora europaea CBS 101466]ETN42557.1 hypothetical protein HMPREF1541_01714 [Cyphellophora europaea CBS 101466]
MAMHGGGAGMSGKESCLPYQLITNGTGSNGGSSDRTLPTPGSRQYTSSMSGTSTLDALPLSALSHRSSIGWSTDSASSASHISSQTSVTGSSIAGHDFSGERSDGHRTSDSQEIAFNYLGFSNSPQASMPNSTLPGANDDLSSSNSSLTYRLSKNDSQISDIDHSSTMPGQVSHQQRCRTISASSTPNLIPTTSQCCHGSLSGNVQAESSNHNSNNNNNSGDLSDSGASSAAALTSSSTTASIIAASAGPGGNSTASSSLADAYGYTAAPSVTHRTQSQTRGVGLGTASGSGEGLGLGRPSNGYTYTRASGVKDYGGGVAAGAGGGRAEDYAAAGLQGSEGLSIGIGGSCQPASSTAGSVGLGGGGGGSRANVASISNLAGY